MIRWVHWTIRTPLPTTSRPLRRNVRAMRAARIRAPGHVNSTQPVGRLRPNDLGLFDLHGNLWEWCQDWYRPIKLKGSEIIDDIEDTLNEVGEGSERVIQGGSWSDPRVGCPAAERYRYAPSIRHMVVGLRLVAIPSQ